MTNTEIPNNKPEKELIQDKSVLDPKTNKLVRKIQRKIKILLPKTTNQINL